jgi:hypothetical protein
MILVIIGDEPLHLGRIEAAVRLGDVNDGKVEAGENIHLHAKEGERAAQDNGQDADHHGDRMPQGEYDRVHR